MKAQANAEEARKEADAKAQARAEEARKEAEATAQEKQEDKEDKPGEYVKVKDPEVTSFLFGSQIRDPERPQSNYSLEHDQTNGS